MKNRILFLMAVSLITGLTSCEYDNYDAPALELKGRLVYQGRPLEVGYNDVSFQLWENPPRYGGNTAISVPLAQEGNFSSLLYKGDYKLIFTKGQGPFIMPPNENNDTIYFSINDNKTMDIEVIPYYMFKDEVKYSYNKTTNNVTVSFSLEQITGGTEKEVEFIRILYNSTQFVKNGDANYYLGYNTTAWPKDGIANFTKTFELVERPVQNPNQDYLYLRVAIKIRQVEDPLYSPVYKLQL